MCAIETFSCHESLARRVELIGPFPHKTFIDFPEVSIEGDTPVVVVSLKDVIESGQGTVVLQLHAKTWWMAEI